MGRSPSVDLLEDSGYAMVDMIKHDLVCNVLPDHGDVHAGPGLRQAVVTRAHHYVARDVLGVQGQAHQFLVLSRAEDAVQNDVDGGLSRFGWL